MDREFLAQFSDLIELGQIENEFTLPGREQTHTIKLGFLWEDDLITIMKRCSNQVSESNQVTWRRIYTFEVLIEAIMMVDDVPFYDPENKANHDLKKMQLRDILRRANPNVINLLYENYLLMSETSAQEIEGRVDDIKKSSPPSRKKRKKDPAEKVNLQ